MYLLDTNICSYLIKGQFPAIYTKCDKHADELATSEIVLAELRAGADKEPEHAERRHRQIDDIVARLNVVPWAASVEFGRVHSVLASRGTPIGVMDTLIASHALQLNAVLVTANVKHFNRVPDLRFENWCG